MKFAKHVLVFGLLGYTLLALWLGLQLPLTWDEGSHTLGAAFLADLARDTAAHLPESLSPAWLQAYSTVYLDHHPLLLSAAFQYPLGHQLITAFLFLVLGPTVFTAKLLAVLFLIGCLYYTYKLGTLLFDRLTGLTAALLLALTPYVMVIGTRALVDFPVAFFVTAAFYHFLKTLRTTRTPVRVLGIVVDQHALLCMLFAFGGITTKYSAFLFFPAAYAWLLYSKGRAAFTRRRWWLPLLALALFAAYFWGALAFGDLVLAGANRVEYHQRTLDMLFLRPGNTPYNPNDSPPVTAPASWFTYPLALLESFNLPAFLLALLGFYWLRREFLRAGRGKAHGSQDSAGFLLASTFILFLAFSLLRVKGLRLMSSFLCLFVIAAGYAFARVLQFLRARVQAPLPQALVSLGFAALVFLSVAFPASFPFLPWAEQPTPATHLAFSHPYTLMNDAAAWLARETPAASEIVLATASNDVSPTAFGFYLLQFDRAHQRALRLYDLQPFLQRLDAQDAAPLYVVAHYDPRAVVDNQVNRFVLAHPEQFQALKTFERSPVTFTVYRFTGRPAP